MGVPISTSAARIVCSEMPRAFFIVGPTATGKSELAADVAREIGAEIASADAFQIYHGMDLLTAKPDSSTLAKAWHRLIGIVPLAEEMNAEKYRRAAKCAIEEINSRGRVAIVVGGSGLYIKALTHGLARLPEPDPKLRARLNAMSLDELRSRLTEVDPETVQKIDIRNRRRLTRALEICLLTGKPASAQQSRSSAAASLCDAQTIDADEITTNASQSEPATGVFVFRDREELYERINKRVEMMFEHGVIEEVRTAGTMSKTASQMIGLHEIRELLAGNKLLPECIAEIQQATRRYAKRQLTWFRRQTNFFPLNLSFLTHNEAVKWISLRILSEAETRDD
jgi:tRNA dimethylallyltransferase